MVECVTDEISCFGYTGRQGFWDSKLLIPNRATVTRTYGLARVQQRARRARWVRLDLWGFGPNRRDCGRYWLLTACVKDR